MNSTLKSGLVLLAIGLICGILLAFVNSFTAPKIEAIELKIKLDAVKEFYPPSEYNTTVREDIEGLESVFIVKQDGVLVGLVYQVSGTGYNGDITMLIAVNSDYTIQGYQVITHKEDAGYGADSVGNNFNVSVITDVSDEFLVFKENAGVDAIGGATYTAKGIHECFAIVSQRVVDDFGGGFDD